MSENDENVQSEQNQQIDISQINVNETSKEGDLAEMDPLYKVSHISPPINFRDILSISPLLQATQEKLKQEEEAREKLEQAKKRQDQEMRGMKKEMDDMELTIQKVSGK